jgi:hypothetical protein
MTNGELAFLAQAAERRLVATALVPKACAASSELKLHRPLAIRSVMNCIAVTGFPPQMYCPSKVTQFVTFVE